MDTNPNLAVYYVLPLVELTKNSFGEGNFDNCYLDRENFILVKVKDLSLVPSKVLNLFDGSEGSPFYFTDVTQEDGSTILVYRASGGHQRDLDNFRKGKYSQFTEAAKNKIQIFTRLPEDHVLVQALYKKKELREELEQKLGTRIPEEAELKSVPKAENFLNIFDLQPSEVVE